MLIIIISIYFKHLRSKTHLFATKYTILRLNVLHLLRIYTFNRIFKKNTKHYNDLPLVKCQKSDATIDSNRQHALVLTAIQLQT